MANLNNVLSSFNSIMVNIRTALINKGVPAASHKFSQFANDISSINTASSVYGDAATVTAIQNVLQNNSYTTAIAQAIKNSGALATIVQNMRHGNTAFSRILSVMNLSSEGDGLTSGDGFVGSYSLPEAREGLTLHIAGRVSGYSEYGYVFNTNINYTDIATGVDVDCVFKETENSTGVSTSVRFALDDAKRLLVGYDSSEMSYGDIVDLSITFRYNGNSADEIDESAMNVSISKPAVLSGMYFRYKTVNGSTEYIAYTGEGTYPFDEEMTLVIENTTSNVFSITSAGREQFQNDVPKLDFVYKVG